jgi:hypothetical protein
VAGESQPPHVGNALAVEDEQVGLRPSYPYDNMCNQEPGRTATNAPPVTYTSYGSQTRRSWTMPINKKGGSHDVSEAQRLQQASLSRAPNPGLVERML